MKKSTYRWKAGARRSDTRLDQKGRKFAYDPAVTRQCSHTIFYLFLVYFMAFMLGFIPQSFFIFPSNYPYYAMQIMRICVIK
ncbi:hypothetical protein HYV57_05650 [Candidatus Peregrinibacteria bacterium]|nr:hypothetical protein [Candidatus Peregrinibacteria bacterium]